MKPFFLLFLFPFFWVKARGQLRCEAYPPQAYFDLSSSVEGVYSDVAKENSPLLNYSGMVTGTSGKLTVSSGLAHSYDLKAGYYFSKYHDFGFESGISLFLQSNVITLNGFHTEFLAYDFAGNPFRQVVTQVGSINETIILPQISIPLSFVYRIQLPSKHMRFIVINAGLLVNFQENGSYQTNAKFNYEAIYQFQDYGNGKIPVFDNSPVPATTDWFITANQFYRNNPTGDVNQYFATRNAAGYSVGLNEGVNQSTGVVHSKGMTTGFTFRAASDYRIKKKIFFFYAVNFVYRAIENGYQSSNEPVTRYIVRDKNGSDQGVSYTSLSNSFGKMNNYSLGVNVGFKFYISKNSIWDYPQINDQVLTFPKGSRFNDR